MTDRIDLSDVALEDCPFCGQRAIMVRHPGSNWNGKQGKYVNVGAGFGTWYVGCPGPYFESMVKECEVHPSAAWYARLADAVRVWNKRVKIIVKKQGKK